MKKRQKPKLNLKRETLSEEVVEQAAGAAWSTWAVWTYCPAGC